MRAIKARGRLGPRPQRGLGPAERDARPFDGGDIAIELVVVGSCDPAGVFATITLEVAYGRVNGLRAFKKSGVRLGMACGKGVQNTIRHGAGPSLSSHDSLDEMRRRRDGHRRLTLTASTIRHIYSVFRGPRGRCDRRLSAGGLCKWAPRH